MSRDIDLVEHFERFVADGHFNSPSDVVQAALSLLESERERYLRKLTELRAAIDEGDASGIADDSSLDGVLAELRAKRSP
jgi:antitoxin ParD1/3/4